MKENPVRKENEKKILNNFQKLKVTHSFITTNNWKERGKKLELKRNFMS